MTDAQRRAEEILRGAQETQDQEEDQQFIRSRGSVRELEKKQAYLITCAQNNTTVDAQVWATLQRVAEHYDAELLVIPIRYKNPTGYDPDMQGRNDQWSDTLHPYMVENEVKIHPRLHVMGQWRLQATTQRPLGALGPITGRVSSIFGHARFQMQTVATQVRKLPKILYTTGSVTRPNYSDTGLGMKGKFHHTNGAVLVRKIGRQFHIRHLSWSVRNKSICDLNLTFTPDGVKESKCIAIVTGDEHAVWSDRAVRNATYGAGGLVDLVKPRYIVRHDVLDSYAISHHHARDPITKHVKDRAKMGNLEEELTLTLAHIDDTTPAGAQNIVVASNHHEHLLRWLKEADPKMDSKNAPLYHKLMGLVLEGSEMRAGGVWIPDVFALYAKKIGGMRSDTRFLDRNESFELFDIEMGLHGDMGPNGRRGSAYGFAQMGIKSITAHTHSPYALDGNFGVGHSRSAEAEYVHSPNSWLPTHCLVHPNGKRQLIHIIRGEF